MRKTISLWMLGIVAMLASCSQDETLQDATSHKSMTTITATISDGMKTRATPASDDELAAIQRCKLVVYNAGVTTGEPVKSAEGTREGNNFTFSLDLDEGNYDFYCWADDGTSYNLDNGLESITVATTDNKPGIAHEGKVLSQKSGESVTIPLQHAVAKVVLQTTANITADKSASVTVQTHTGYSVFDGKVAASTSSITETKAIATTDATTDNPVDVLSFYVLVDKDEEPQASVTVAYGDDDIEVANVPIKADCRTVLKGDLTALAFPETTVTATLDQIWDGDEVENIVFNVTSKSADDLLQYLNNTVGNKTGMTVRLSGTLTDEHFTAALREFLSDHEDADLTLDLSQTKNTTIPREAFYYTDLVGSQVKTWDSKGLSSIILPECLTTIEPWAFKGCSNLKSVDLTHVTNIGRYAFNGCSSLSDITFPAGDFNIQGGVFTGTAWLKQFSEFTIPSTWIFADDYGYGLLHESHIVSVTIPKDYKGSYVNLLWKTESLESVTIEGDITSIGEACFHLCKKLTTLDLSACTQVPVIEDYAFGGVGNETDVTQITVYVKDADMEAKFEAEGSPWIQRGFTKDKIQVKP